MQPVVCEYGPVEGLRELFRNRNAKMKRFGVKKSIFCLNSLFDGPNAQSNNSSHSSEEDEFEDEFEEEKKEEEKKSEPRLVISSRHRNENRKLRKAKDLLKNIKSMAASESGSFRFEQPLFNAGTQNTWATGSGSLFNAPHSNPFCSGPSLFSAGAENQASTGFRFEWSKPSTDTA